MAYSRANTTLETPDAYLQYLLFYEDSTFHQAGFASVTLNALDRFEHLTLDLEVGEDFTSGFMYIYVANESSQDVYFDDVQVTHESATSSFKVSQINEYYPFGLTTSRSWRNAAYVDPGLLYQSSYASYDSVTGYYDFLSRSYDPVLGRFFAVDPAGQFGSPYVGMGNMPMMTVDPDGELAWFVPLIIGGVINTAIQGITKGFENGWQVLGAFAVGAATSAVTMGIGNGLTSGFNFASHASGSLTFGQGFAAGVQGTFSGSALNVSFASGASSFFRGAAVGGSTGLAGGFIGGFGNAWNGGESLKNSLNQGLSTGGWGALSGGIIGGVSGGVKAVKEGKGFWNGQPTDEVGGMQKVTAKFLNEEIPKGACPTKNCEIAKTSKNPRYGDYGMTRNQGMKAHRGLDFVGEKGDPVFAMHDGIVNKIGGNKALGPHRVRLKVSLNGKLYHNNYGHLSKSLVNVGDKVLAGQQIGIMGRLGNLMGTPYPTHVHVSFHRYLSFNPIVLGYVYPSYHR